VSSTNNATYGPILVDGNGRTLYLFTPDDGMSTPQCTGGCAQTWPPLKASGAPHATGGAQQSLLGVESGQVTYNGHPLYRYASDSAPGQTNGQGVGGIWYVVSTSGNPVLR
jgi:predicted lipoprotein with Yx(FWY)xxD motif